MASKNEPFDSFDFPQPHPADAETLPGITRREIEKIERDAEEFLLDLDFESED